MKDLLLKLGKRVQELRRAKGWSQEELAHVSGLHRTYIGQVERGEKNISFNNLVRIAGVLGVSPSGLLAALDRGVSAAPATTGDNKASLQMFEIQKAAKQLRIQQEALAKTVARLESLTARDPGEAGPVKKRSAPRSKRPRK